MLALTRLAAFATTIASLGPAIGAASVGTAGGSPTPAPTASSTPAAAVRTGRPDCLARSLALTVDEGDGAYAGMQQNGVRVTIRNVGTEACAVQPFPPLVMRDRRGRTVATPRSALTRAGTVSRFAVFPADLAPGAATVGLLRWVSADAFGDDPVTRVDVATLVVHLPDGDVTTPLVATIYAPARRQVTFSVAPFHLAPSTAATAPGQPASATSAASAAPSPR